MIVFDLRCDEGCPVFEGWFDSSTDFEGQFKRGLVQCPYCESPKVGKAPMAPRVSRSGGSKSEVKDVLAEVAALQVRMLSNSEWVGSELPDTARAMHLGDCLDVHGGTCLVGGSSKIRLAGQRRRLNEGSSFGALVTRHRPHAHAPPVQPRGTASNGRARSCPRTRGGTGRGAAIRARRDRRSR